MSEPSTPGRYVTPGQIHKILGPEWGSRVNVYYWLAKCDIKVVDVAGFKMVPAESLATVIMTLKQAKEDSRRQRDGRSDTA